MNHYYHLTSFQNAQKIQQQGFNRGKSGMLGPGIYSTFYPADSFKKAKCPVCDTIIIASLETGRLITVDSEHHDWNLQKVKTQGYDSVQKLNCRTGPEICVYEPDRVKIIGMIHWNKLVVEFRIVNGNKLNSSLFTFLAQNRKVVVNRINNGDFVNSNFYLQYCKHNCDCRIDCAYCGAPKCQCGFQHDCDCRNDCRYCGTPKCQCGFNHNCDCRDDCRYCGTPKYKC